jgi:hypothetical protein
MLANESVVERHMKYREGMANKNRDDGRDVMNAWI